MSIDTREFVRMVMNMKDERTITNAYAEWDDDGQKFRVYLEREYTDPDEYDGDEEDPNEARPLKSEITADSIDARLYKAAFCAHPKDFGGDHERLVGFDKKAAAERCAKAVVKELKRIEHGEPGPDAWAIQVALAFSGARRKR